MILTSGLGDNGGGGCVRDGPFAEGKYNPVEGDCLERDWNYKCVFVSASWLVRNIVNFQGLNSLKYEYEKLAALIINLD